MVSYEKRIALRVRMLIPHADDLKDVIQHLFEIQSAVHGYLGPETQQELVRKMYVSCASIIFPSIPLSSQVFPIKAKSLANKHY
jgi:hypothetical protein